MLVVVPDWSITKQWHQVYKKYGSYQAADVTEIPVCGELEIVQRRRFDSRFVSTDVVSKNDGTSLVYKNKLFLKNFKF